MQIKFTGIIFPDSGVSVPCFILSCLFFVQFVMDCKEVNKSNKSNNNNNMEFVMDCNSNKSNNNMGASSQFNGKLIRNGMNKATKY